MKALSVKQPWAWLQLVMVDSDGIKPVENREWNQFNQRMVPQGFWLPERVYIHASQSRSEMTKEVFDWITERLTLVQQEAFSQWWWKLTFGAIIGEETFTSCVTTHPSPFFVGKYGWVREAPRLYTVPVTCPGQLGFFDPGAEVEYRIRKQND
jgi:hypothetical protein